MELVYVLAATTGLLLLLIIILIIIVICVVRKLKRLPTRCESCKNKIRHDLEAGFPHSPRETTTEYTDESVFMDDCEKNKRGQREEATKINKYEDFAVIKHFSDTEENVLSSKSRVEERELTPAENGYDEDEAYNDALAVFSNPRADMRCDNPAYVGPNHAPPLPRKNKSRTANPFVVYKHNTPVQSEYKHNTPVHAENEEELGIYDRLPRPRPVIQNQHADINPKGAVLLPSFYPNLRPRTQSEGESREKLEGTHAVISDSRSRVNSLSSART
ncbi:hypothetical protein SNE40_020853 [Patella caerulea]|uniref:Uncharacterized protein n=1 Tax=Patella caerulea TaxID=87958 RepID=A0AAN8J520_PATCE